MVEVTLGKRRIQLDYLLRIHGVSEEQFDEMVDEDTRAELLDGVMIVHSPASAEHDKLGGFLRFLHFGFAQRRRLGEVLGPETLVHLATCRRFAPDLFFLRTARVPPRPWPVVIEGSPDLAMEILSPSNRDYDLEEKRPAYQKAGVEEIWLVDPENRQLTIDRQRRRRYATEIVSSGRVFSRVLNGFWLEVDWLWSTPLPEALTCLELILAEP